MSLLTDLLTKLGLIAARADTRAYAVKDGVALRWTRDLRALPAAGLPGGHLVELHAVLDERHELAADAALRFDVLDESGFGAADTVVALLGTGAPAPVPDDGIPTRRLLTTSRPLPAGERVADVVERFKSETARADEELERCLLIVTQAPDATAGTGTRRTHVLAWHRVARGDGDEQSFRLVAGGAALGATAPVLAVSEPVPGVAVRVVGWLVDADPLQPPAAEPLAGVPLTLGGRRAVTDEYGAFGLDARLAAGDHVLRIARPGIAASQLTVRVALGSGGRATATLLGADAAALASATTPDAAGERSRVALALPAAHAVRVHKLRGTVLWPDSRPGSVAEGYHGTPLAERHVYVLPLPAGGTITEHRPQTTREWEALKRRPETLRSARPGQPGLAGRTGSDGRFEVKYVDFTAGNRFLIWSERFDPLDASDTTSETPDHVVRTLRRELIQLTRPTLPESGQASELLALHRNLVDHEYNLTSDRIPAPVAPRSVVAWGVDALRVVDLPAPHGLSLVRPSRSAPDALEGAAPPTQGVGEERPIPTPRPTTEPDDPALRIVDGFELQVLALVLIDEAADRQGAAARRAVERLASAAADAFPDGYDASGLRFALDVRRLGDAIDPAAGTWDPVDDPDLESRKVKLLESTFVVRPQLGTGRRLAVDAARWHIDAVSLADGAFISIPPGEDSRVRERGLDASVAPVLGAVSPLLAALAPRRVHLLPGHGLWANGPNQASVDPEHWISERGGYASNAGEDEVDALLAAEVRRIVAGNGATVLACRESHDFTRPGVRNIAAAQWFTAVLDNADFPRLWQQNAVYFLGATGETVVTASPALRSPANDKNAHGMTARQQHVRALAFAGRVDIIFAPHTNAMPAARAGEARGTMIEYLNAEPAGGGAGEGNPLGRGFARHLSERIVARCHTRQRGVETMLGVRGGPVGDLIQTFDHGWLERLGATNSAPDRRVADGPLATPAPEGFAWRHKQFRVGTAPLRIPVALAEVGFHDNAEDAALLGRAWFRRLAAEGMAMAIEDALRDDAAAISHSALRAVLARIVGTTEPVAALAQGADVVTPESVRDALRAVCDPAAPAPADPGLGAVTSTALAAARTLTRAQLVDLVRDALRPVAGWQFGDPAATVDAWVRGPITGAAGRLERPDATPTRAEAGVLACAAVGLTPASLATAERQPVGGVLAAPLLRPASAGDGAYFPAIEAAALAARLAQLHARDVYRVARAWLADGAWAELPVVADGAHVELEAGEPVTVVVQTAGAAWKTANQDDAATRLSDVEIRLRAGADRRTVACGSRDARVVTSRTWFVDLAPSAQPVELLIELWVRHRAAGMACVGVERARVKVSAPR